MEVVAVAGVAARAAFSFAVKYKIIIREVLGMLEEVPKEELRELVLFFLAEMPEVLEGLGVQEIRGMPEVRVILALLGHLLQLFLSHFRVVVREIPEIPETQGRVETEVREGMVETEAA